MILTQAELTSLTGYRTHAGHRRQLRAWGVPFLVRRDGSVAVSMHAIEAALGVPHRGRRWAGPDLQALDQRAGLTTLSAM